MNVTEQSRSPLRMLSLIAVLLLAALPAAAQEEAMQAPEMSAEEAAMMETWMKAMTPGPQHEMLAKGAGEWKFTLTSWMDPEAEPMVSEGTAVRTMELGGRVAHEVVTASFMGQPFEGIGRTGYDNLTGKWWSTWTDNMSTSVMVMEGDWDEATESWTFVGEGPDMMTGGKKAMKMVLRMESEVREVGEMWEAGPDGEMHKVMEIVYTR